MGIIFNLTCVRPFRSACVLLGRSAIGLSYNMFSLACLHGVQFVIIPWCPTDIIDSFRCIFKISLTDLSHLVHVYILITDISGTINFLCICQALFVKLFMLLHILYSYQFFSLFLLYSHESFRDAHMFVSFIFLPACTLFIKVVDAVI